MNDNSCCGSCCFWGGDVDSPVPSGIARCRRYPPVLTLRDDTDGKEIRRIDEPWAWAQPTTYADDVCGEWAEKPKEKP